MDQIVVELFLLSIGAVLYNAPLASVLASSS